MTQPQFKGEYRVESIRLPNRDYATNGWYFVNICTQNRTCFFGNVVAGQMQLSEVGKIAHQFWAEIPNYFPNTYIDAYAIAPNHVHGIIAIDRALTSSIIASTTTNVETRNFASLHHHEQNSGYQQQLDTQKTDRTNKFARLKPGSLQAIMHAYKSAVTRWCRKNGFDNFA
jgi:REP element-mobilizing transposase RayT